MKMTINGNYSFRKPLKRKGSNVLAFIGLILICLSLVARTQYFTWNIRKNQLPNEIFSYAGIRIYSPIEIMDWQKLRQT